MRVLLISRCAPYPLHLGDRLIVYHLARELSQRGHEIDLVAFSDALTDLNDQPHYADFFRHITLLPEAPRSQISYLQRLLIPSKRFPSTADQSWSPDMWHAIRQHIETNDYGMAHLFGGVQVYEYAHAVESLPVIITPYESYALFLKRRVEKLNPSPPAPSPRRRGRGGKESYEGDSQSLLRESSLLEFGEGVRGWGHRLQLAIARRYESFMFTPYPIVTVVSDVDRGELLALDPSLRVEVIPNGVDLDYFQPMDTPRDPNMLLFTGNFEYAPNLEAAQWLIKQVVPRVKRELPDAKLYLVGANPPPELQAQANDSIVVVGKVPDMRPYLAQAGVYLCPLLSGAGIKNKVLEAMAMGCAVIGSDIAFDGIAVMKGKNAEIGDHAGSYAEAAVYFARHPDRRDQIGANARALIESRYSWHHAADSFAALYAEIAR